MTELSTQTDSEIVRRRVSQLAAEMQTTVARRRDLTACMRSLMDEMGPKIAELNQMNAELRVLLDQRAKWRYKSLRRKTEPLRREVEGAQGEVDSLLRDKDQIEALGKLQMEEADVLRAQLEPGSVATAPVTLTVPP